MTLAPVFISSLLTWYDNHGRDLPWRKTRVPACGEVVASNEAYSVLVSEIMLQQTTVAAVIPYYKRWMNSYPTVADLAAGSLEEVLRQWEGLGYYSRARNLHAAAIEIITKYGGIVPEDPKDLMKLQGIGEYTSAAVASIAYGVRAPALDANNLRVWSRLLASSDGKKIATIFRRIIPANRPGDFNQALMDLGSIICIPKSPECSICPLAHWCRAYQTDTVSEYPQRRTRSATIRIEAAIGIIVRQNKVLVQKRPDTGLMAGLWEFPGGKIRKTARNGETGKRGNGDKACIGVSECRSVGEKNSNLTTDNLHPIPELPEAAVIREVREETGLNIQVCEKLGEFTHTYTKFRVKLHVYICEIKSGKLINRSARWVTLEELEELAMPSVNRRIVRKLEKRLNAQFFD